MKIAIEITHDEMREILASHLYAKFNFLRMEITSLRLEQYGASVVHVESASDFGDQASGAWT